MPGQLITTVTIAPLGLNVRCTRGLPVPCTVTVSVVVWPAASVPDIGATTTFFSRPGGSETDQFTAPPDAVSVIDPPAGGATLSVAGLTLSVPAPGESLVLVLVLALALALVPALLALADDGAAVTPAVTPAVGRPAPALTPAVACTPACAVALGLGVPGWPSRPRAGFARPLTPGVAAPAGGTPGCGGTAIQVTPAATAAAVPATAPAWAGPGCSQDGPG